MHSPVQELFLFIDQAELVFQRLVFLKDSISNVMSIHLERKTSQIATNIVTWKEVARTTAILVLFADL